MIRIFTWLLFVLWVAGVNVASSLPGAALPAGIETLHFDNILHFAAFFCGGMLLDNALRQSARPRGFPRFFLAFAIVAAFGIIDELRQVFIPGRNGADPFDMLANVLGALAGASVSLIAHASFRGIFRR